MGRILVALALAGLLGSPSAATAQWYVYGSYCSACMTPSGANQLYDDGLHGDGAAGDGVWGVDIPSDRPAGKYSWWVGGGNDPYLTTGWPRCIDVYGTPDPAALWTTGPGDVIHFRAGGSPPGTGWGGSYVACDHGMPAGTQFEVAFPWGNYCEQVIGSYPAQRSGTIWSRVVTWPGTGTYYYWFRATVGNTVWFWKAYNAACYLADPCPLWPLMAFTTTQPNADVRFEFDEVTGKMRAVVLGPTAARSSTWGSIKAIYR